MQKNNYPGKFIVLEGLDGSGQSTQVGLLKDFLIEKGLKAIQTKEPTIDSEAGRKIREVLEKKIKLDHMELQKLFAQDRKEHLENLIIPALKRGEFVVSDRYFLSSFAYGASDGIDLDWLIQINDDFLLPDKVFILKVKPAVCISRIEKRGMEKTLFEKEQKLAKVWETYEILPGRLANCTIVDGEKPIKEVFNNIKETLDESVFAG